MDKATESTPKENNKRVVLNILSNLLYQLLVVVFGFLLPRLFLINFGSQINGLDSSIKKIFAYLTLFEAGIGLSAQYALYEPVATSNTNAINAILSATRKLYLKTSVLYAAATLLFAFGYPLVVDTGLPYQTVCILILLYAVPGIILFSLRGKYNAFLEVDGKNYILTNLSTFMLIVSNLLRMLLLIFSNNLILIQATYCLPSLVQIFVVALYVRKKYPWIDWRAEPNPQALSQKKAVMVHEISNCIFDNTDTILISIMCGMQYASVYAVYSLFFTYFNKIVTSFSNGITFKFGQLYSIDKKRFEEEFSCYQSLFYMFLFMGYTVVMIAILPVIRLYTRGIADSAIYDSSTLMFLFAAWSIMTGIEVPLTQLQTIAGKFEETKEHAIWGMIINLAISIGATWKLGIVGCLLGTLVALFYRIHAMIFYISKNILPKYWIPTNKRILVNAVLCGVILYFTGTETCSATRYLAVFWKSLPEAICIAFGFLFVNIIIDFPEYKRIFRILRAKALSMRFKNPK